MRIGIDARMMGKAQATGIGVYIQELVARIIPHDTDHEYVVFVKPENKHLMDPYQQLAHVTIVVTRCHWYSLCEQILFCAQLYRYRLDIVHFPQFNVPVLYRKPFVVTIHDVTPLRFPGHTKRSHMRRWAFHIIFKNALRRARTILTVSQYSQEQIQSYFPHLTTPIVVTYLGVDNNFKERLKYDKIQEVRARFGLAQPYLLSVGVMRNHKNLHGLVRAFAKVRDTHHVTLVVGGARANNYTELDEALADLTAATRDAIVMPGFIADADLPALYQGAAAYVVASFEEGFGLNGLEAMASGIPVIASHAGSLPEIYGDTATYCDPNDTDSIAAAITRVLTDPSYAQARIARGTAHYGRYSWDAAARTTRAVYTQSPSDSM